MAELPIMQIVLLVAGYLMIGSAVAVVSTSTKCSAEVLGLMLFWPFVVVAVPIGYYLYGCVLAAQQLRKAVKKKED